MTTQTSETASNYGLEIGTPDIKSVGAMAFGPDGILFVADNSGAAIFALDLGPSPSVSVATSIELENLDTRLAAYLGCPKEDIFIRDMAVHPSSQDVYLSIMRGRGDAAVPLLVKATADGVSEVSTEGVPYSKATIQDAPKENDERMDIRLSEPNEDGEEFEVQGNKLRITRDPLRSSTVTDMAYADGILLVAGASNEEFSSSLRKIPFPFKDEGSTSSLEIFHVSHGMYETASPIRSFVPYGNDTSVLASYTCTPVVQFALSDLHTNSQAKGKTVADLGAMNTPLDMVSYKREGKEFLLVSNTSHPLMKISCSDIDAQEALTSPHEPVGVPRENLPHEGVSRMANLNGEYVLMIQRDQAGDVHLRSYASASL